MLRSQLSAAANGAVRPFVSCSALSRLRAGPGIIQGRCYASVPKKSAVNVASGAKPKVLVIAGPTAVGKTALALRLAQEMNGEIISADSVQMYKGFDVGTNKIFADVRKKVPHHLIDVIDTTQQWSVVDFYKHARAATEDIIKRGKTPIVVGGASFYLRWYLYGPSMDQIAEDMPFDERHAETQKVLADWVNFSAKLLKEQGMETLQRVQTLKERNDFYRLSRALAMIQIFGHLPEPMGRPTFDQMRDLDFDFRCVYLEPSRSWLYRMIDYRCELMVQNGLIKETKDLLRNGVLDRDHIVSRAIGYRQAIEYLDQRALTPTKDFASVDDFMKFLKTFQAASRNYSVKQQTAFKHEDIFRFVPLSHPPMPVNFFDANPRKANEAPLPINFVQVPMSETRPHSPANGPQTQLHLEGLQFNEPATTQREPLEWTLRVPIDKYTPSPTPVSDYQMTRKLQEQLLARREGRKLTFKDKFPKKLLPDSDLYVPLWQMLSYPNPAQYVPTPSMWKAIEDDIKTSFNKSASEYWTNLASPSVREEQAEVRNRAPVEGVAKAVARMKNYQPRYFIFDSPFRIMDFVQRVDRA